jgi:GNAT superfamily N-acetyltransferase
VNDPIVIRELTSQDEFQACVDFQQHVWGAHFSEVVPAAIQWVARRRAASSPAHSTSADMLGFLFGITGFVDGRPLHWSDMLAVDPEVRGLGIGTRLKRYQRDQLLERGMRDVQWTFDPLESRNAWVNFAHLGITAREYIRDCYGVSDIAAARRTRHGPAGRALAAGQPARTPAYGVNGRERDRERKRKRRRNRRSDRCTRHASGRAGGQVHRRAGRERGRR